MIRQSSISLNSANQQKLESLRRFGQEYTFFVNSCIDMLWTNKIFYGRFIPKEIQNVIPTWLGFSAKQCAGKQALQIVKKSSKQKNFVKPLFHGTAIELDQRFTKINFGGNSFDIWIKFHDLGDKLRIIVPAKKHKHFNKFSDWNLKKSTRLRIKEDGRLFLDFFFEKDKPEPKIGKPIGIDCGYKKLAVTSEGQILGTELQQKAEKISRKIQGSNAFKRALIERNQYVDQIVKQIDLTQAGTIVIEDLKNVKSHSKGKISRKVMNKLQRWTYPKFLNRLEQRCEISGVHVHKVNPAYTSQTCSVCGSVHKESRLGELFKCVSCGHTMDADLNASKNILQRFLLQEHTRPVQKTNSLLIQTIS